MENNLPILSNVPDPTQQTRWGAVHNQSHLYYNRQTLPSKEIPKKLNKTRPDTSIIPLLQPPALPLPCARYSKPNRILLLQGLDPAAPGTMWIYLAHLENQDQENAVMFTPFFRTVAAQEKSDGERLTPLSFT